MSFADLPLEILWMIVKDLEDDYRLRSGTSIFTITRVNRLLRILAFEAHFRKNDYRLNHAEASEAAVTPEKVRLMAWDEYMAKRWERKDTVNMKTQRAIWPLYGQNDMFPTDWSHGRAVRPWSKRATWSKPLQRQARRRQAPTWQQQQHEQQ